jgi:hypothetical protein
MEVEGLMSNEECNPEDRLSLLETGKGLGREERSSRYEKK